MCGIAGVVAFDGAAPPSRDQIAAMCRTLVHRGPDDEGIEIEGSVGLGMRRLSVIDLHTGRQPLFNEDRSVSVVFNGEIYNYRELRADLVSRGHSFATATDGEVIVHLWEEHGPDFLRFLNGMFAIALHDSRAGRVVLARDRLGIKPLFYQITPTHLVFGSEVKAVLASGLVDRRLDLDGLSQLLAWEYVPAPRTLLRDVKKLDAAELIETTLPGGSHEVRSWWDVPAPADDGSPGPHRRAGDWEEAVDAKIRECVRRQLVADVPLGAFLSGGVDSSLVVAAMPQPSTFSIGFDDPSYNELQWSTAVAEHLKVRHQVEVIRPDAVELFSRLMHYMDDPIGDFSIFPTYLVSRLARSHVTVALSGDGGDELFGGYDTFVAQLKAGAWGAIPAVLRRALIEPVVEAFPPRPQKKGFVNKAKRFVEGVKHDDGLGHARWRLFAGPRTQQTLFSADAQREIELPVSEHIDRLTTRAGSRSQIDRCLYVDVKSYLVDNCLVKVDRMSMACSLETRVPLLDHELVELAFQVPAGLKVRGGKTKVLLKKVASRHVPERIAYRPKEGFSIPIKNWLKNEFRELMEDLLAPARVSEQGIFDPVAVDLLKREHLTGVKNHSHLIWTLMVFQDWRRRWAV